MAEAFALHKKNLEVIPILNEAKASMNRVLYEVPFLDKAIPSYENTLSASEQKCIFIHNIT